MGGSVRQVTVRFVVIGGGPAGVQAASTAARLGAQVTLIERDVVGGAANLWDCVPSKAMIATGSLVALAKRATVRGLEPLSPEVDLELLAARVREIEHKLAAAMTEQLLSQGVEILRGTGRFVGPHSVEVSTDDGELHGLDADAILVATGSYPRVPEWAPVDGKRVLTTRQAYPPPEIPDRLVVVGSGVTGVEFVHMFRSLGLQGHASGRRASRCCRRRTRRSPPRWRPTSSRAASRCARGPVRMPSRRAPRIA